MVHTLLIGTLLLGLFQEQAPKVTGRLKGHAKGAPLGVAELEAEIKKLRPQVEKLRGETFQREVTLVVLDEAGFATRLREHVAAQRSPEERTAEGEVAKLLAVIPLAMDWGAEDCAARERRLSAFYDARADALCMKAGLSPGTSRALLVRGLCEALDDQLFDFEALVRRAEGSADARRALEAVTEGSSMGVMRTWALQNLGSVMPDDMEDATTQGLDELADAPPYLWKADCFSGLQGAAFLTRMDDFRKAGNRTFAGADVSAAYRDPPRSSEQILHAAKYWDEATRDDPVPVRFALGDLPEGWALLSEDTLGELGWGLVVEPSDSRQGLSAKALARTKFTFKSSIGWGGDRYLLLGRGDARLLLCETVWDTPEDANEFAAALGTHEEALRAAATAYAAERGLSEAGSGLEVARQGEQGLTLLVWAGASDDERMRLRAAIRAVPPTEAEGPR